MTVLKRKALLVKKLKEEIKEAASQANPKSTGNTTIGGKIVWVYKPKKLPYKPNHLSEEEIQTVVARIVA